MPSAQKSICRRMGRRGCSWMWSDASMARVISRGVDQGEDLEPFDIGDAAVLEEQHEVDDHPETGDAGLADDDADEEGAAFFEELAAADFQEGGLDSPAQEEGEKEARHQPGADKQERQRMQREARSFEAGDADGENDEQAHEEAGPEFGRGLGALPARG